MRIAISTKGNNISSQFDPRFGRAAYFVLVDDESGSWESYANPASGSGGGAGVKAAQFIADQGAQTAISGDFGPNAFEALSTASIRMVQADDRPNVTAQELLDEFREGRLRSVTAPAAGQRQRHRGRRQQSP